MEAVLLAGLAGACFGAMAVATRAALARSGDPDAGALVTTAVAFVASALVAVSLNGLGDTGLGALWPFVVVGVFVPGVSQLVLVRAIRAAGASRAFVLVGTAPLMSAALAVALLRERLTVAIAVGTALVVCGGMLLVRERTRPEGFRVGGVVLALLAAALFALRDNAVRWASVDTGAEPLVAATASLAAAAAAIAAVLVVVSVRRGSLRTRVRQSLVPFLPAGVFLALAYDALVAALDRGEVVVVAPLNATQSLWAVLLAALVLGRTEAVGRRLVLAGALVFAGGALVAGSR